MRFASLTDLIVVHLSDREKYIYIYKLGRFTEMRLAICNSLALNIFKLKFSFPSLSNINDGRPIGPVFSFTDLYKFSFSLCRQFDA